MKKKTTLLKSLLIAVAMLAGVNGAWADDANLSPVGVFTWTNAPAITYDAEATSWAINQGGISGGKLGRYAGPYAIVKFDASSTLAEKTLLSATLDFDITAGSNNSSINIALLSDATFDPATVTTATFDATASQFQAGEWSTKNATKHFSYNVKSYVEANNVLAFAIYTNTGREQTLKNVVLKLEYSTGPVATYNYSLKAVKSDETLIKELASGEEYVTNSVTAYFPYMFYDEGTLYTTSQIPYSVTFDKDNTSANVTYEEGNSNIVAFMEGETSMASTGENADLSNGKCGYAEGNKTPVITTLAPGKYKATIRLVANGNRSIVIRNTANSDVETNVIVSLPISKSSAAGLYESDEFTITESTTIGFSGYTSGTKTNQSADIDYIYITKTGDIQTVDATVTDAGWATFVPSFNVTIPDGVEAYYVSAVSTSATLTQVETAIPAGAPVLLKAAEGTYTFTQAASAAAIDGNLLKISDGEAMNVLVLYNGDKGVGFYNWSSELDAGKVYLDVPAPGRDFIGLSFGEATGINAVESAKENGAVYNLAGQRVAQPTRGLYIVNGKKVIVK